MSADKAPARNESAGNLIELISLFIQERNRVMGGKVELYGNHRHITVGERPFIGILSPVMIDKLSG